MLEYPKEAFFFPRMVKSRLAPTYLLLMLILQAKYTVSFLSGSKASAMPLTWMNSNQASLALSSEIPYK
jgi:hypothetical protein